MIKVSHTRSGAAGVAEVAEGLVSGMLTTLAGALMSRSSDGYGKMAHKLDNKCVIRYLHLMANPTL